MVELLSKDSKVGSFLPRHLVVEVSSSLNLAPADHTNLDFFILILHATSDSLGLDNQGTLHTDVSDGVRLLSGETLLQAKNSTGRRWDSNQGPC